MLPQTFSTLTNPQNYLKIRFMESQTCDDRFRLPDAFRALHVPVILASDSPRRSKLFSALGLPFKTQGAQVDETHRHGESPEALSERLAFEKAEYVARNDPESWVIGADTVVVGMGRILGKPRDEAQAAAMLELLSGRTHRVLTGVALVHSGRRVRKGFVECTRVSFRHLQWAEIEAYLRTGQPMDKAGAYGIQGQAGRFIPSIEGSYTNVVGLPMERLRELLVSHLGPLAAAGSRNSGKCTCCFRADYDNL